MAHYRIFNDEKLNNLLDRLYDLQPGALSPQNEKGITVSEKLILIGNLANKLNEISGGIINTINKTIKNDRVIRTSIAPTTLNNLVSDVYMLIVNNSYRTIESFESKYDYVDVTNDILGRREFTYKPTISVPSGNNNALYGTNDELNILISNVSFNLIIKIYIILLGMSTDA